MVELTVIVEWVTRLARGHGAGVDAFVAIVVVVARLAWVSNAIAGGVIAYEAFVAKALARGREASTAFSLGTDP